MISQLHHALLDLQIEEPLHEWVKRAGKVNTFVVELDKNGNPLSIRSRTTPRSFWRVEESNHSIFPTFKIEPGKDASRALMLCVKFAKELQERLPSLRPLIERVACISAPAAWFKALEVAQRKAVADGVMPATQDGKAAYILFDLPIAGHPSWAIDSDEMGLIYSRELTESDPSGEVGMCALTGKMSTLEMAKYPKPNLPGLGGTYLQSMNVEIPCQMRYHTIGTTYYPVSKDALRVINSRLVGITQESWKGKTWSKVSVDGKKALLIAHAHARKNLELAELFASESTELYAQVCKKVVDGLRAYSAPGANPEIVKLLVLKEIDPGRKGVEFVQEVQSEDLLRNVQRIRQIIGSAPQFTVTTTLKGRTMRMSIIAQPLAPAQIARTLNEQWLRHGDGVATVHGNHLEDAVSLLTSNDPTDIAKKLCSIMCQRALPLLAYSKGNLQTKKRALSVLYLLRQLADEGDLMETIGFKLGRYLSVCDWLHKTYCDHVRDGKYPNQLIGNSYFQHFADRPERGLASMALRLRPYLAWAQARGAPQAGGIAHALGKIAAEIADTGVPKKLDDSGRADLLLGYLYQKPKAEAADTVQQGEDHGGA